MIEQQPEHFGLEHFPFDARRGRDRDEVAPEIDPVDHVGGEQGAGERAGLGGVGIGEVAPAGFHHCAAGQEFAGRRIGRAFGFNQHEQHVAPGPPLSTLDGRHFSHRATSPAVVDHLDQRREVLVRPAAVDEALVKLLGLAAHRRVGAGFGGASIANLKSLSISAAANPPS